MHSLPDSSLPRRAMRRLARFLGGRIALALMLSPGAAAAVEPAGTMFRPLDFPAALETAAREQRVVLVDFFTTWCGPCRLLDETTWQDSKVVARVGSTAVAIRIDAEKERALAKRYEVKAYPTILVIGADGKERDRYVGYLTPAAFLAKYETTLAGGSVAAEAHARVRQGKGAKDPKARLEVARDLAKQPDRAAEALAHFLWCYDEGVAADPRFARDHGRLPAMIAAFGKTYPPALDALRERRATLWSALSAPGARPAVDRCAQLGRLDAALRDEALIVAAITFFKPGSAAQKAYGEPLLRRLAEMKRYSDALAASDIDGDLAMAEQSLQRMQAEGRASAASVADLKRKAAIEGALPLEILAGAGEIDQARRLARSLLAWDDSPPVREALARRLERAGAAELAAEVAGRGK